MASNRFAVCKVLKETCVPGCTSAPHFPPNDTRFEDVHQIFGAANVRKILDNLTSVEQREIAANSLCYAAEARRRDSISGCHGMILHYESILNNIEQDIKSAVNDLETNVGRDQVPKYFDIPIPDDFLTPASLDSFIEKIKSLPTVEKNQRMQLQMREDQNMGDGHGGADGASTSAGPSSTLARKPQ